MTPTEQIVTWTIWGLTAFGGFFSIRAAIRRWKNRRKD
jgi:hypothetical protein